VFRVLKVLKGLVELLDHLEQMADRVSLAHLAIPAFQDSLVSLGFKDKWALEVNKVTLVHKVP